MGQDLWGALGWIPSLLSGTTSQSWDSPSEQVLPLSLFSPGLSWNCLLQGVYKCSLAL